MLNQKNSISKSLRFYIKKFTGALNITNFLHSIRFFNYYLKILKIFIVSIKSTAISNKKRVIKYLYLKKKVNLFINLKKRNIIFNLTNIAGDSFFMTTLRREGYTGRRQLEYTSVESTALIIKSVLENLKITRIGLYYNGWHRFRYAIRKVLDNNLKYYLKIKFIKYRLKIPHNGCRLRRLKNQNRKWFI